MEAIDGKKIYNYMYTLHYVMFLDERLFMCCSAVAVNVAAKSSIASLHKDINGHGEEKI